MDSEYALETAYFVRFEHVSILLWLFILYLLNQTSVMSGKCKMSVRLISPNFKEEKNTGAHH